MKHQVEKKIKNGIYEFEEVPCPVCKEQRFELFAKKDRYGLYMPVVICKDCGLIQTNPRMNQISYNEFYNVEYRKLYIGTESPTDNFFKDQYNYGQGIFEYLRNNSIINSFQDLFVLEVGCGAEGILRYFEEKGCRVKGIDLDQSYIECGTHHYDFDLSVGTIDTLEIDERPDLIIYSQVLEHILTPDKELRTVYKIMSDEGRLYVEVPGVKNLMNSYEMDFLQLLQNAHTYHFTLESLTNLLKMNYFDLLLGNEKINSVFIKSKNHANYSDAIVNDYSNVMAYIQKVERLRIPRSIVINILKTIGLLGPIRYLYRKIS